MTNWTNTHVLILGAARQGLALARWLSRHGANVTLNDSRREEDLVSAKKSLSDVNVTWAVGGHPLELLDTTEVLCISGGVPLTLPIVEEALKRGVPGGQGSHQEVGRQVWHEVPVKEGRIRGDS